MEQSDERRRRAGRSRGHRAWRMWINQSIIKWAGRDGPDTLHKPLTMRAREGSEREGLDEIEKCLEFPSTAWRFLDLVWGRQKGGEGVRHQITQLFCSVRPSDLVVLCNPFLVIPVLFFPTPTPSFLVLSDPNLPPAAYCTGLVQISRCQALAGETPPRIVSSTGRYLCRTNFRGVERCCFGRQRSG